ncbi:MAG: exonuclease SbcCD subunit D [Lepagella sp.]
MKILHTSDWHLGHNLYNYDRSEEHRVMLQRMKDIVAAEKPDVFLLCGDVFHTSQPSSGVQRMFSDAIVEIHKANPDMTIIITAGNHDSGTRHDIYRTPWKALNVYTIGNIDSEHPEEHIFEMPGRGYVIAVPYTNERNMPDGWFKRLTDRVEEMNVGNMPVVMTAHITVNGCDSTGHDNNGERSIGGIDAYELGEMGQGYDYLALGHIHRPQYVDGERCRVRYSGTPIPVSFDENYPHTVSIVEIGSHGEKPTVREIEIANPRPLVTLPTEGATTWEDAKRLLSEFPDDIEAYIRLNVEVEGFLPTEASQEAHNICENKKCRFCVINAQRKKRSEAETKLMTVQEFKEEKPIDIAKRYAEYMGKNWDDDMTRLFEEALKLVSEDNRQ